MLQFLLFIFAFQAFSCPVSPESLARFKNLPHTKSMVVSEFTEGEFKDLIARVRKIYDPVYAAQGKSVEVLLYWDVNEGNAMTSQSKDGKTVYFLFSGGLLRGKYMSKDSFLFAACHEMGHQLGGFPKEKQMPWSSTEGEADYFANLKCMKEVLKGDPENVKALELNVPGNIRRRCRKTYADDDSFHICLRSTMAAEGAYKFLQSKERNWADADESLFNQILIPVEDTLMRYPPIPCRAETAYRGAICEKNSDLSDTDETAGVCHKKNGDRLGMRPNCWFKDGVL